MIKNFLTLCHRQIEKCRKWLQCSGEVTLSGRMNDSLHSLYEFNYRNASMAGQNDINCRQYRRYRFAVSL